MKKHGVAVVPGLLLVAAMGSLAGCPFSKWPDPPDLREDTDVGGTSGTTMASGGMSESNGVDGGMTCVCTDDANPCTDDRCEHGTCQHPPKMSGTDCGAGGMICNGKGACVQCLDDGVTCMGESCPHCDGASCANDAGCASKSCVVGICRLNVGDSCNDAVQCDSNFCDRSQPSWSCKKCEPTGDCTGEVGQPCDAKFPCRSYLSCVGGLCLMENKKVNETNGWCGDDFDCISKHCDLFGEKAGWCSPCDDDNKCSSNATCIKGRCQMGLAQGKYCIDNTNCAAPLKCTGFPRKCQ